MKPLDLNQTVYSATQRYPELIKIIIDLGFPQIRNNYILRTLGRKFTLNQAIAQSGLDRKQIIDLLISKGFLIRQ